MGPQNACKRTTSDRLDGGLAFRELCGDTGGLDKERTMSDPERLVGARARTSLSSPPRLRPSGSQIPAAPAGEGPRRTNPAAHRGRGSTSACPQEQQRRASRFSAGGTCVSSNVGANSVPAETLAKPARGNWKRRAANFLARVGQAGCPPGPSEDTAVQRGPDESPYAAAVRVLLEDGPMQGKTVEAVEGRPPKTIDVPDEKRGTWRYCLAQSTQEGMTAAYTFLYAV
jgi:hypothetical protein